MKTFHSYSSAALVALAAMIIFGGVHVKAQNTAQDSNSVKAPAGDAKNGKRIFVTYGCYECHGYMAQGGGAGPRIGPDTWPYTAFIQYMRNPKGEMPPFTEKVVSDKEVADIYAFLESLPHPPDAKTIPLLTK